ncbi:hypothetical protein H4F54_22755, partial [Pectobacterium brasiliense]|nr:hypothetical protein [Pectobacterium brasiliense]
QKIRRECVNRVKLRIVIQNLVVKIDGKKDQDIIDRNRHDNQQQQLAVHRTRSVIRVNDDNNASIGSDLFSDIIQIG